MMRRWVVIFVLAGMCWQAVGLPGLGALASVGDGATHAFFHWSESAHHHHDDGTYDQDDSDEAVRHVLSDDALTAPALCSAADSDIIAVSPARPGSALSIYLPDPLPDRLRRPPRNSA